MSMTAIIRMPAGTAAADSMHARGPLTVIGATVIMGLGFGALSLISVFMRPLESEFGWSRSDTSLLYGLATVGMALGGLFWGRLLDRVDLRVLLAVGGFGVSSAILAMSAADALWQMYLASIVLGGLGFSVLYAPLLAAAGEWFPARRGLVTGIVTAGGALGQGIVPFASLHLIEALGWRNAYVAIGLVTSALLAATLPMIRRPAGYAPVTPRGTVAAHGGSGTHRARVALLSAAAFLCCACMGVPLVHLASYIGAICGSPGVGATSLLVAMVFGAIGRVCFGSLADRIGPLTSYAAASATQTLCVLAYPFISDGASLLALSAVFGFGFAGNMTCLVLCVRQTVAPERFGGTIGMVMLVAWAGMASGGYLGGWLYDQTLAYTLSFALAGTAGGLNLVAILALQRVTSTHSTPSR